MSLPLISCLVQVYLLKNHTFAPIKILASIRHRRFTRRLVTICTESSHYSRYTRTRPGG